MPIGALCSALLTGCFQEVAPPAGSGLGGTTGTGGAAGSIGAGGHAGSAGDDAGHGGDFGMGGSAGAAGEPNSGGAGSGGTQNTGGSTNTGGSPGTSHPPTPDQPRYEAEDGTFEGTYTASAGSGFSGTGYVTGFRDGTTYVEIPVAVTRAGVYELTLGSATPHGSKVVEIAVNGARGNDVTLAASTTFTEVVAGRVSLPAGTSVIRVGGGWGWYDIDYVGLKPWVDDATYNVADTLVSPRPSAEAVALHGYLRSIYRTRIVSGQHELADAEYVASVTGRYPALLGLDLMRYSPNGGGTTDDAVQQAIAWHERGGIVTFTWHWWSPSGQIDDSSQNCPWYRSFYTECTTFDITRALTTGTPEHEVLLRDLDAIAVQLEALQQARVPVLFRPLHEAEGGWFWWGARGPTAAIELYRLMFERYTEREGLDNLIWVWNSVAQDWYPGDAYVDVISADIYPGPHSYDPQAATFSRALATVKGTRLVALSENGAIPDPDLLAPSSAYWSWFMTWSGEFIRDGHISREQLLETYHHEYVITLDELPDWRP